MSRASRSPALQDWGDLLCLHPAGFRGMPPSCVRCHVLAMLDLFVVPKAAMSVHLSRGAVPIVGEGVECAACPGAMF
jgi:hypothetical protein